MNTQKAKIELFARLARLGFSYDECAALTRCEMALTRWRERECGDGSNWAIERDEATGKPFDVYHGEGKSHRYPIADREAGALKRAQAILDARNNRICGPINQDSNMDQIALYNQTDCRGCALYLIRRSYIPAGATAESVYTRGVAVCA